MGLLLSVSCGEEQSLGHVGACASARSPHRVHPGQWGTPGAVKWALPHSMLPQSQVHLVVTAVSVIFREHGSFEGSGGIMALGGRCAAIRGCHGEGQFGSNFGG